MAPKRPNSPSPARKDGARSAKTRSSPAPNRPDKGKASPAMARSPSTEQLDDEEEEQASTPLTGSKDRVKVWLRVSPAECAANGPMEERSIVSVDEASIAVKVGGKSQQADGVIAPAQSVVSAASAELLSPLVEHAADRPAQKVAVLLCYGEDAAGRDQALVGSEGIAKATMVQLLSAASAAGRSISERC